MRWEPRRFFKRGTASFGAECGTEEGGEGRSECGAVNSGTSPFGPVPSDRRNSSSSFGPQASVYALSGGDTTLVLSARAPLHVPSVQVFQISLYLASLAHVRRTQTRTRGSHCGHSGSRPFPTGSSPSRWWFRILPKSTRFLVLLEPGIRMPRPFKASETDHVLSWLSSLASHVSASLQHSQVLLWGASKSQVKGLH